MDTGVAGEGEEPDGDLVMMNDEDDDFVVKRRDTKVGRAVTSGPVQYSVAESVPNPRCDGGRKWRTGAVRPRDHFISHHGIVASY